MQSTVMDIMEQVFQGLILIERISAVAAMKNTEVHLLTVSFESEKIKFDILSNNKAVSISLEKGDVNQMIDFAERLSQITPKRHIVLYLSSPSKEQDRIAYDSDKPVRHGVFYPRMVRVRTAKELKNSENY